ncbi:MAG: hypothetical protein ABSH24_02760 [Bryobacteraceae bacterium]|jgi:hypothetical protein
MGGYLADGGAPGESTEPKRQMPGGRHQNDDMASPYSIPVPPVATAPLGLDWGLAQSDLLAATIAGDQELTAAGSGGSGSASEPAVLPQPQDDLAGKVDAAKALRDDTLGMDATRELAFAARLLPLEPTLETSLDKETTTTENERTQAKNTETPETSRGAHTALLDDWQSELQNTTIAGSGGSSSTTQEDGRRNPDPDQRNADSLAGIAAKGGAVTSVHLPGDRIENAAVGLADMESAWNTATMAPAEGQAQSAVSAQEASQTGAAVVEPPEPPAQPASRDVSLHLADGDSSVDIRMAERAGEIRVTVHTPDRDLANSLRADLPDLVGKLRQTGFQAEAWRPAAATPPDGGRRSGSDGSPSQEHSPGNRRDGRQQPQQQQPKDQPRWDGEWKSTLDPAQESHT